MAYNKQTISTYLERSNPNNGGVVTAESVAVTYNADTGKMSLTLADALADLSLTSSTSALKLKIDTLLTLITTLNKLDASLIKYTPAGGTETTVADYLANLITTAGATNASDINYTYISNDTTEVTEKLNVTLDNLRDALDGVSDISDSVSAALLSASNAAASAATAESAKTTIVSTINEKVTEITEINNSTQSTATSVNNQIATLSSIASQLQTAFNADLEFDVISKSTYNNLASVDDNKIYFIYDDDTPSSTNYTLTLTTGNNLQGTVVGTGVYSSGSSVVIVGLPKSGYEFDYWSDKDTFTADDGDEDWVNPGLLNPRTITMTSDKTLIAYFKSATT